MIPVGSLYMVSTCLNRSSFESLLRLIFMTVYRDRRGWDGLPPLGVLGYISHWVDPRLLTRIVGNIPIANHLFSGFAVPRVKCICRSLASRSPTTIILQVLPKRDTFPARKTQRFCLLDGARRMVATASGESSTFVLWKAEPAGREAS